MELKQRIATVVDYDAWNRGYMPPSEHVLIDQLAYRGARVVMSTDFADHGAIWIVMRDIKNLKPSARKILRDIVNDVMDDAFAEKQSEDIPEPAKWGLDKSRVLAEASHYAAVYAQDGPVELRLKPDKRNRKST